MASKAFSLFSFTVSFLLLPLLSRATSPLPSFEFLVDLQGYQKGDKVRNVSDLRRYFRHFGYLKPIHSNNTTQLANDDYFDDEVEAAIKTYQLNYDLNVTGVLDAKTVSKMMVPRCGVADIINGTTWMRAGKKTNHPGQGSFHTVSHYSFFPSTTAKWPASKYHLTCGFLPGTTAIAMSPVARAFSTWAANTHFTFSRAQDHTSVDLLISFHRSDHGDGNPFDGAGGVLAHAFAPTDGRFHFDADERWTDGANPGAFDIESVALHEIGHLLGLGHSSVEGAIMHPSISAGVTKLRLHGDDIQGIRALYNTTRPENQCSCMSYTAVVLTTVNQRVDLVGRQCKNATAYS